MPGLMRWLLFCCSLSALAACDTSAALGSDFGVELPGCRQPSACWKVNCGCNWDPTKGIDDCRVCNPADEPAGVCDCTTFTEGGVVQCEEQAAVCVGHGASTCDGLCARAGSDCGSADKEPPDEVASVVGSDGGPGTEKRCPFANDVCCPN